MSNIAEYISDVKWPYKFSVISLVILMIFLIVSLSRNEWIIGDFKHEGLWETCSTKGNFTCCSKMKDTPAFIKATQAFIIMTLLILPLMILIRIGQAREEDSDDFVFQVVYTVFGSVACLFLLLATSIYGGMYGYRNVEGAKLRVCFALCASGMLLLVVEGIVVFLHKKYYITLYRRYFDR